MKRIILIILIVLGLSSQSFAQKAPNYDKIFGTLAVDRSAILRNNTQRHLDKNDIRGIADNLLAYQNPDGGWTKNIDWLDATSPDTVLSHIEEDKRVSSFENKNTTPQIEYLCAAYRITKDERYSEAALRGLDYVYRSQHANGGWRGIDVDAICFNDNLMGNMLNFLNKVSRGDEPFDWFVRKDKKRAAEAYKKALDVTLKCQVRTPDGKLAGWGQQHDNETFLPCGGRSYELPCIASNESSALVISLMAIPEPSKAIREAIEGCMAWLERSAIKGIRIETIELSDSMQAATHRKNDRRVVKDDSAPRIWARCYETDTNTPFFCNRDGIKVYNLSEVSVERRAGYGWYGYWPEGTFHIFEAWKKGGVICRLLINNM